LDNLRNIRTNSADRINMVIIDRFGRIRDVKNVHFPEVINLPKEKSKTIRQEALAELVRYAVAHGVRCFVVEKLHRPEKVKGKTGKWALREYLQQMRMLVKKVGGELVEVNPAYTSIDARGISLAKGIDIHTASAYLIALRGIKRRNLTHKVIT
jgi:IS605 OrfB family transposase